MAQIADLADYRQQPAPRAAVSPVERLLADARLRLVETGTRNRLVHTPRGAKRTRSVVIVNAVADALFEAIAHSDRAMRLMPTDTASPLAPDAPADNFVHLPDPVSAISTLQTNLADTALEKRLLTIYRDAKTAEEEQGINILYLAIGFLGGPRMTTLTSPVKRRWCWFPSLWSAIHAARPSLCGCATRTSPQIKPYRSGCLQISE